MNPNTFVQPEAASDARLVVLSPEPAREVRRTVPADRVASLEGCSVGLLDNNKPGATVILRRLGDRLLECGAGKVLYWRKALPSGPNPNVAVASQAADVVISGVGDCGSCSSWSLRDALDVELLGRPTVTLVSEPFGAKVNLEADAFGMPSLPVMTVPHPMATLPDEELEAIADSLLDGVVAALVAGPQGA